MIATAGSAPKARPSGLWYLLPAGVMVVAVVLAVGLIASVVVQLNSRVKGVSDLRRVELDGGAVALPKGTSGIYYVYDTYNDLSPADIATVRKLDFVVEDSSGQALTVTRPRYQPSWETMSERGIGLATVQVPRTGTYRVRVTGLEQIEPGSRIRSGWLGLGTVTQKEPGSDTGRRVVWALLIAPIGLLLGLAGIALISAFRNQSRLDAERSEPARIRPSAWWWLLVFGLPLLGFLGGVLQLRSGVQAAQARFRNLTRVEVGRTGTVTFTEAGDYTLYFAGTFTANSVGDVDRLRENLDISLTGPDGQEVSRHPYESLVGSNDAVAIDYFHIGQPGDYRLRVDSSYFSGKDAEALVGKSVFAPLVPAAVRAGVLAAVLSLAGLVAGVVIGVRRSRSKRSLQPPLTWRGPFGPGPYTQPGYGYPGYGYPGYGPPGPYGYPGYGSPGYGPPGPYGPPAYPPSPTPPGGWTPPGNGPTPPAWAPPSGGPPAPPPSGPTGPPPES